ncbi:MAG: DUF4166 domain-containing protein [Sulfuriflexus sp.]|nr:DUF4166 domain-containing protein [Sulfuriflexus sp.]
MSEKNIMYQALGKQWEELPPTLLAHYQTSVNTDVGVLDIEYPRAMQIFLNVLHLFGALLNRRGKMIPATVKKIMKGEIQYWERTLRFPDGETILFKSCWVYAGGNQLIEYVNPFLGLRMAVYVKENKLYYEGIHYVIQLGRIRLPLPEWLMLGHTTIVESELDATHFAMDFRLHHPLFGQVYRYAGEFETRKLTNCSGD